MSARTATALWSLLLTALCAPGARAQCPQWSTGFQIPGVEGVVNASAVFDDGSGPALYIGGSFASVAGVPAQNIARWDGAVWSAYGGGIPATVRALAVYDAGAGPALYAGTDFHSGPEVARWNGSSWVGADFNGDVRALRVFDEGAGPRLFAGGVFSSAGGVPTSCVARWNGTAWSTVGTNLPIAVNALEVHDTGAGPRLYAAASTIVVCWNGSFWLNVGSFDADVYALRSHDEGAGPRLFAGGEFSNAGGATAHTIARWNGSTWSALPTPWTPPVPGAWRIDALSVFDDGGGPALFAGGTIPEGVARWNGTSWLATTPGASGVEVATLTPWTGAGGPGLFAGGSFEALGAAGTPGVALWRAGAWQGTATGRGLTNVAFALAAHDEGSGPAPYVGGRFRAAGGNVVGRVARWNGAGWSALGSGIADDGDVLALASFDDGGGRALYAGGVFSTAPIQDTFVRRWRSGAWSVLPALTAAGGGQARVSALAVHDDGSGPALYAAGVFAQAGGVGAANIARWNGSGWSAVGAGLPGPVTALCVFGTRLYAAVSTPSQLHAWDGLGWTAIPMDGPANALVVHDDGTGPALYVAGQFGVLNGVNTGNVARWDGATAASVGGGMNSAVFALGVHDAGGGPELYAAGLFLVAGTQPASRLARWDGSAWGDVGGGTDLAPRALLSFDAGGGADLWVGGTLRTAGAEPSGFVGRWEGCGPGSPAEVVCTGDGAGTPCPCGNQGAPGNGCANSLEPAGAHLAATGTASLANDTVVLAGSGMPIVFALYFQGNTLLNGGAGVAFGDGLRCASNPVVRLGTKLNAAGASQYPEAGDPSVSQRGLVTSPGSRTYQCWYRNAANFCTPDTFNLTNALRIQWGL